MVWRTPIQPLCAFSTNIPGYHLPIVKSDVFLMNFGKLASVQIVDYDQQKIFEIGDVLAGIAEERGVWVNIKPYRLANIFLDSYKHVWPTAEEFAQSLAKRKKAN